MKNTLIAMTCAAMLAACGGGNDTPNTSGEYHAYTTDGRHFPVLVDFNAMTYSYVGDGTPHTGKLNRTGSSEYYSFVPNGLAASAPYPGNFYISDTVLVGQIPLGTGAKAFIAGRSFSTNLADVSGKAFAVMTTQVSRSTGASTTPVRWQLYRVDASSSTMSYCAGVPSGVTPGLEPLSDPLNCPAGTVKANYTLGGASATGGFPQTVAGSPDMEARFAKVGSNIVFLSSTAASDVENANFTIGVTGDRGKLEGVFPTGTWSLGGSGSLSFGSTPYTITTNGGSMAQPGGLNSTGTLAELPGSTTAAPYNALRYMPSNSSFATSGMLLTPGIAVLGNFQATNGDLTIFLR